jgi:hypothetical protein
MTIGRRTSPSGIEWERLPPWLQVATYFAYWIGGPVDERDVARLEAGILRGAGWKELFAREEPRWMVSTLMLLDGAGKLPVRLKPTSAYEAVGLWCKLSPETVRRRCCGDRSIGHQGKWDRASEEADSWCKANPGRKPFEVKQEFRNQIDAEPIHQYREIILNRFPFKKCHFLNNRFGAVIRIPRSWLAVIKMVPTFAQINSSMISKIPLPMTNKEHQRAWLYCLVEAFALPGKEIQSVELDSSSGKIFLGYSPVIGELPPLSKEALQWLDRIDPSHKTSGTAGLTYDEIVKKDLEDFIQPEAGQK